MQTRTSSRGYFIFLIVLLMLVAIVNTADKELLDPVADAVRHEFGMNDTELGAVRSAVFVAALLGQFLWGPLSDRWVRKHVITIGTIIWSSITWLTALVGSFPQLLAARAGMSFAEGCFNPSAYALITDEVPAQRHGLVLGLLSLTYPVGTAAALVVASIIGTSHWREPFWMYGVLGIALGFLVWWRVREPARGASTEGLEGASLYTGRFSFAEFRRVLAIPSVLLAFGLDTCQATVNWNIAFWAPTYLTRYHIAPNAEAASLALLPAIIGFVLGALLGGAVIDRMRRRTSRAAAIVALAAMSGGLVLAFVVFNVFDLTGLMVAAFLLGLVSYMALPAVSLTLFSVVPPETKATCISTSNIILNSVIAVVSFLVGVVSDAMGLRLAFSGAVLVMFGLGVLDCLALLRFLSGDIDRQKALVQTRMAPVTSPVAS